MMVKKIANNISKGIKEGKWIEVSYCNAKNETTYFWMAIKDIIISTKTLVCDIFNHTKGIQTLEAKISFDGIKSADVLPFTSYDVPQALLDKLDHVDPDEISWLGYDGFNSNILNYYIECGKLDNDPFQKEYFMIEGIDLMVLRTNKVYIMNQSQINFLITKIYHNKDFTSAFKELVISVFAISSNNKKYVICYYPLSFDPSKKSLIVSKSLQFNKSFLIDGRKRSISNYVEGDIEKFIEDFKNKDNYKKCKEEIEEHLSKNEIIDTRPDILLLQRDIPVNLSETYKKIETQYKENKLSRPLKAFYGNLTRVGGKRKEPPIILYDEKVNIDQMRVIYNAMTQPVTYVQGPPGTGKTQTILNVILTAFVSDKTLLISSSNNTPINGIMEKLRFKYFDKEVKFPFLRLGNNEEIRKATLKIRELFSFEYDKKPNDNLITQIIESTNKKNEILRQKLKDYEKRLDLIELIDSANKLIDACQEKNKGLISSIKEKIEEYKKKLDSIPYIQDEDVLSLFQPISKDTKFMSYLFFKSLKYISKLKTGKFTELINICKIEADDERVRKFNNWTGNDENLKTLISAFPIILTTNISASRLGNTDTKFDLAIIDEAGQCNVAHALLPIARAENLLLVGDTNQLRPVIILEDSINDRLMEKYEIDSSYSYKSNSILSIMKSHDSVSKKILLSYHYRCGKKIIDFSNQRYYGSDLKTGKINFDGDLRFMDIKNNNVSKIKNENIDECLGIIDYIKRNEMKDVAIITPFRSQQKLMNDLLSQNGLTDISCSTVHSLQGAEKDTIIFSASISPRTSIRTFEWLKNNAELINVAVTRAKKKLIVSADSEALNKLSDKSDDLYALINYVRNNGETEVSPSLINNISIGKSNSSKAEDEFYKTISQFCTTNKSFDAERNVAFKDIFSNDPIFSNSGMEFDLVLYERKFLTRKVAIVIEINGGEHFGDRRRERLDKKKQEICKEKGWKFLSIPNTFVKSYEEIRDIILSATGKNDEQLSLFDD